MPVGRTMAVARRAVRIGTVMVLVSLSTMLLLDLLPGDPARAVAGEYASDEVIGAVREELGLNEPLLSRYIDWVSDLASGDLGRSAVSGLQISEVIIERLPVTLQLSVSSVVLALLIAVPLATYAASRPDGIIDRVSNFGASLLLSMPTFLIAILLSYFLAVANPVFPVTAWARLSDGLAENIWHAALPTLSLALAETSLFFRVLRSDMGATLQEEYILAARARGIPRRWVLFRHALRLSSFTLLTVAGVAVGRVISGTIMIEAIFGLPGLGQLVVDAISSRDYLMLRGIVVTATLTYIVINLLIDLSYSLLDPRVRAEAT